MAGLVVALALKPFPLVAQADAAKVPHTPNRYLLVVETSRSMQRRADGVLETVDVLLKSDMGGQLRRGDTLGIWTYNESLYAGRLPLQRWSPENRLEVTLRTLAFLKEQKYEKQASLDKVVPALDGVVKASPRIMVILISSADEKIHGTPFDDRINSCCQKWYEAQQKARMPFVIVLRGQEGQFADFTVNTPPWPMQMPPLPQEAQSKKPVPSKLPDAVRAAPPPTAPPLIVSGRKPKAEVSSTPTPEPAAVKVQAPAAEPGATNGSEALMLSPASKEGPPTQVVKTEAAPSEPAKPPPDLPATSSPATQPVPGPKTGVVPEPEMKPVAPAPVRAEAPPALPPPTTEPKPAPVATARTETGAGAASGTETSSVAPMSSKVGQRVTELRANLVPGTGSPSPSPRPVAPSQTATAVPAETLVRRTSLWIAGLVLGAATISLTLLLRRRARAAAAGSLITQSIERKNKP